MEIMKSHVNLLPYSVLSQQVVLSWLVRWAVIGGLAVAGAAIALANVRQAAVRTEAQRERLEAEYRPVAEAKQQAQTLRAQIDELEQREAISMSLCDERPVLAVVGLVSRAAHACRGGVAVEQLEFKRDGAPQAGGRGARAEPGGDGLLSLTGVGRSNVAVSQFAAALRDAGVFQRVEVKSTAAEKRADGEFQSYTIECGF
jgi:Tfp pilus assembly protein PilN